MGTGQSLDSFEPPAREAAGRVAALALGLGVCLMPALSAIACDRPTGPPGAATSPSDAPAPELEGTGAGDASGSRAGSGSGSRMGAGTTARASVTITRTNAAVGGVWPEGFGRVEADLRDVEGAVRGTGSATIRDGRWLLHLTDPVTGADTYPAAGERIELRWPDVAGAAGDAGEVGTAGEQIAPDGPTAPIPAGVTIPELSYRFDTDAGRIVGQVDRAVEGWGPDGVSRAAAVIGRPELASAAAEVDADGGFAIDVGSSVLEGGASAVVSVASADGAVVFVEDRRVPYVRVSLRPGDVSGAMAPLSEVELELSDAGGALRARGQAVSGPDGRFEAWVRDADGRRVRPLPGDRLRVGDGRDDRDWRLPAMSGAWDRSGGGLTGGGSPGNAIKILMWNPWRPGADGERSTTVGAEGAWSVSPPGPIGPATHYYITERFPSGDELYFCYQVPMLHVEPGSPIVRVEALWEVEADVELRRDGRVVGSASGGGPWSGELHLELVDDAGQPVIAAAGDRIVGRLDELPVDVEVAALEAAFDGDGRLAGRGPAGAEVGVAASSPIGERARLGSDGRFALDARDRASAGGPLPGESLSVFTIDPQGHATHRRFVGPSIEVLIDPPSVTGHVDPRGPEARLVRIASDGRATPVELSPDATGRFVAALAAPIEVPGTATATGNGTSAGTGTGSGPGGVTETETGAGNGTGPVVGTRALERFELTQAGVTTAVTIPALSAALEPSRTALSGVATPHGIIDIDAWIGEAEMPESLSAFADGDGRWRTPFGPEAPGRFTFGVDEVSRFEIRLRLGHNAVRLDVPGGRSTSAVPLDPPGRRASSSELRDRPVSKSTRAVRLHPPEGRSRSAVRSDPPVDGASVANPRTLPAGRTTAMGSLPIPRP